MNYAEALVECGYADYQGMQKIYSKGTKYLAVYWIDPEIDDTCEPVAPFADTIEGRRQADALEDWLVIKYGSLWKKSTFGCSDMSHNIASRHQWRLNRIKWCFEQMESQSDGT